MYTFVTVEMAAAVAHNPYHGSSIADVIAKREQNPRRAAALVRARKKFSEYIKDDSAVSLAQLRLSKGMSQQNLADAMGVKQPYIARIERGEDDIKVSTVMSLAKALGESPATVFQILEASREARGTGQ